MLKYTILFTTVFCMVQSQRPWHAGTGGRLPQVLPQYMDERVAAEQAAQATPTAQGDQIIPSQGTQTTAEGQEAQGVPVGQGAQEIPVRQGAGIPAYGFQPVGTVTNQGAQGTPTYQGAQGVLMCPCVQGTPTYQGAQGVPMYQGAQGIPMNQGAQETPIINTNNTVLGNRIAGGDSAIGTTINPADLPVDAHGDIDLINRIKSWPRDKQPFWYINWQAIQAHRGDVNNTAQPAQTQPNTRSFFAG